PGVPGFFDVWRPTASEAVCWYAAGLLVDSLVVACVPAPQPTRIPTNGSFGCATSFYEAGQPPGQAQRWRGPACAGDAAGVEALAACLPLRWKTEAAGLGCLSGHFAGRCAGT